MPEPSEQPARPPSTSTPEASPVDQETTAGATWRAQHYVLVGLAFFALYQVSLFDAIDPDELFWRFGADNMIEVFERRSTSLAGPKHPLFAVITPPLYSAARALYAWAPEPAQTKLALGFPAALLGALNTALAFWIFRRNRSGVTAAGFGFLYGLSAATWIFSSYPDTYVLTALTTSAFVAVLVTRTGRETSKLLAAANALACYASPQQIFLGIVPVLDRLRSIGPSREWLVGAVRYGATVAVLFVIPYLIYLEIASEGWKLAPGYVKAYSDPARLIDPSLYPVVLVNFLVFSVVGPLVHPSLYRDPTTGFFAEVPLWWFALVALYGALVVHSLRHIGASLAVLKPAVPSILAFLLVYSLFFLVFNPGESFIYSFPGLLLWLLVLQTGFSARETRTWRVILAMLVAATAANNVQVILLLHRL